MEDQPSFKLKGERRMEARPISLLFSRVVNLNCFGGPQHLLVGVADVKPFCVAP